MSEYKREAISELLRYHILNRDKFTCRYCGGIFENISINIDHVIPVCEGGKNYRCNLVVSCVECNLKKSGNRLDDEKELKILTDVFWKEILGWNGFEKNTVPDELIEQADNIITKDDIFDHENWMKALEIACNATRDIFYRLDITQGLSVFFCTGGKIK